MLKDNKHAIGIVIAVLVSVYFITTALPIPVTSASQPDVDITKNTNNALQTVELENGELHITYTDPDEIKHIDITSQRNRTAPINDGTTTIKVDQEWRGEYKLHVTKTSGDTTTSIITVH